MPHRTLVNPPAPANGGAMTVQRSASLVSRRAALIGAGAASLGASLALAGRPAAAQGTDLAGHPLAGVWLAMAAPSGPEDPSFAVPSFFNPDGTVLLVFPPVSAGPTGLEFQSSFGGTWEADGARRGHFTAVQSLAAADGTYLGTVTLDGHPEVSADGQRFIDTDPRSTVTIRDAAGAITMQAPAVGARPVPAIRMAPGRPGFPEVAATAATPAATPSAALPAGGAMAAINGVELYYEAHGPAAGAPVLLLHGSIDSTESFDGLIPALVDSGYRTIAFDGRGRGRSAWGEEPLTYALMASDALELLDLLGIEKTDLVGLSAGATLALELAINHPERLGRVVAFGGSFTVDGEHDPEFSPALEAIFEELVTDYQRLSPEPQRFDELLAAVGEWEKVEPDYSEAQLRGISVPVLVLDGAEEEFVYPEHTVRMAALIPSSELIVMPGTGHFAPDEQPAEFNRIVLDFLEA